VTILRCLDVEDADAIDESLAAENFDFVNVDRERLHESYEAGSTRVIRTGIAYYSSGYRSIGLS